MKTKTDLRPKVSDEVRKTTCYMCACRCGIDVHIKDGKAIYIEGNRDHPVNKGILCAKGASGLMQHYSPARLRKPLKRAGPRGSGKFKEISWEEALSTASTWLGDIRKSDPKKLAFFTGRDQSQSFTGLWAQQFGTPNFAAHGGFCSVNMATAGIYTMGGSFWEFSKPDWEHTKLMVLIGVAEDHASNPLKASLAKLKERGGKILVINPVKTGYGAIADDHISITPGSDALFILSIVHELLRTQRIDLEYLSDYTNLTHLVRAAGDPSREGLMARDENGDEITWNSQSNSSQNFKTQRRMAALTGQYKLDDGATAIPAFELMSKMYLARDYAPDVVASQVGCSSERIRKTAALLATMALDNKVTIDQPWTDWLGKKHDAMTGSPVSFYAMRGISAHSNGFQTCRAIHLLQLLLGAVERPGGMRFSPPYPKHFTSHPKPHFEHAPNQPLAGPNLGYPRGPEDLAIDSDGKAVRIDKAFSWDAPLAAHGALHMVISNAVAHDPYAIDTLFLYMANMAWNSSMNSANTMDMLCATNDDGSYKIPHIIYSDAYSSEMVSYADLILPDTTYLERYDCISMLDRPISEPDFAADGIRWPVVEPDRDVRSFQSVLLDLGARLDLPGFVNEDGSAKYSDYGDYITSHERAPGIGPLAGWRDKDGSASGRGGANPDQLKRYIENGSFWQTDIPASGRYMKPWNSDYQAWSVEMGFAAKPTYFIFEIYQEILQKFRLAALGHGERQPPEHLRESIANSFNPLPIHYEPFENRHNNPLAFPYHAITQRPPAMYHAWGSQNSWLRQIYGHNVLYVPSEIMEKSELKDDDWAWVESRNGKIRVRVKTTTSCNGNTMWTWNAIGKRKGAWSLKDDAPEHRTGFLLNHLISEVQKSDTAHRISNSDPITGQAAWFDLRVNIRKDENQSDNQSFPQVSGQASPLPEAPENRRFSIEHIYD